MPTLNIKNERVYELARQLADATGASMTSAIESALEEKLERMGTHQKLADDARTSELTRLLDDMARRMGPVVDDPTADLFDEVTGLPRGD